MEEENYNNNQGENTEMTGASQNSNPGSYIEIGTKKDLDEEVTQVQGNAGSILFPKKYWEKGRARMLNNIKGNSVIKSLDPNGNGRATTRSSAKGVLTWSALNDNLSKACRVAACTVESVQGGDPMPSPFAPTVGSTTGNADPSLYVKVTWQSIAHLFSYYMDGTEENVNKVLGKINGNEDEMGVEEDIVGVADITKAQKGIAEEDLENGEEELEIADCSDEITSNRKEWPAMPKFTKGKIVYIPIAFLHALADKEEHPWLKLESMRGAPRDGLILENKAFKFAKSVKLFTKEDSSGRNPSFKRQVGSLWLALRDGNGHLIFCLHDNSWAWKTYKEANCLKIAWRAALGAITPPSMASGGKPPRYQVVPVGELKIKITALGEARWRHRGGAQALFETFIAEINKNETANCGKVSLYTGDDDPTSHRLLSEDPFGLYKTYISFEGYNSYMNFLLLGAVPENKEVETYKSLREITDTRALPKCLETSIKLEKKKKEGEMEIENGNQDQKAKIIPLNRMRINQDKMKDRDKIDADGARNNGRDAIKKGDIRGKVHERSSGDIQTLTVVNVNARKIVLAKGQRKNETRQQGTVMAASAPDTARQLLSWQWIDPKVRMGDRAKRESAYKPNEMFNGLYIAEWLHLSAYSWGGLADPQPNATVGEAGSSQVHQNFVLGTSETNSVMTRWEKAWQDLIEYEGDLLTAAGEDGRAYGGQLTIVRHPFRKLNPPKTESKPDQNKGAPSTEIRESGLKKTKLSEPRDNGDKDKQKSNFQIPPKSGTTQFASFLHDVAHAPTDGEPGIIQWAPESTVLDVNLQRVAKEFRWVCYQFDYDLYINAPSKILGRNGFSGRARFYPFRRMLYHKIERDLDAKVWKDMLSEVLKK